MQSRALTVPGLVNMAVLAGTMTAGAAALAVGARAIVIAAEKPAVDEAAATAARQRLVGEWKLNAELSEDPREKMRQARVEGGGPGGDRGRGGGGRGGGRGGGGWGGGGHGGGPGGRGGGRGPGQGRAGGDGEGPAQSMLFTATHITVTNLTPEVTILDPDGQVRRLHADDKAYKDVDGAEVRARWNASQLVVETRTERGRINETWTVSEDPRRLTVLVDIQRSFGSEVKVRRVFDPVRAEEHPR